MSEKGTLKPRNVRRLKRSGFLEKIKPTIPNDEEILSIQFNFDSLNRIVGYTIIPLFSLFFLIIFILIGIDFTPILIGFAIFVIIGTVIELYFIFMSKIGYNIKMLVFTNTGMYLFDNKHNEESIKYEEVKNFRFNGKSVYTKSTKFIVNFDLQFKIKSTIESLKFNYFILYNYCNPKIQVINKLRDKEVPTLDKELQKIINKSKFKISNERLVDIQKRKASLLTRFISYELFTLIIMVLLLLFVLYSISDLEKWWFILIWVILILGIGIIILIGLPINLKDLKRSFKKMNFLPDSHFEIHHDGIKAFSDSGDIWFPYEENLIISQYNSLEKIFPIYSVINDGVAFYRFGEKKRCFQIGPVEDYKFFSDIVMLHYLEWLDENGLILSKETIRDQNITSDPLKKSIAEKLILKGKKSDLPLLSELSSFNIDSDRATFKYPKNLYNHYISKDEKIFYMHHQDTIPSSFKRKIILLTIFIVIFGLYTIIFTYYLANDLLSEMLIALLFLYIYVFPLLLLIIFVYNLLKTIIFMRKVKSLEAIFTDSRILFKQKKWLYPLAYEEIKRVYKVSENIEKRLYKSLEIHPKKGSNVMIFYDVAFDNPILSILNARCQVSYRRK